MEPSRQNLTLGALFVGLIALVSFCGTPPDVNGPPPPTSSFAHPDE